MSRKALLINAPAGRSGILNTDLEATRNFLLSPRGGAWYPEEIVQLDNPSLETVMYEVTRMTAGYTITFFSGLGFADAAGSRFLILENGDFFEDTELLNDSPKQLVLVDAWRETFNDEVFHFTGRPHEFEKARLMYDKWIAHCEPGQVIIHSTQRNTHAVAGSGGGAFTQKLLQVASAVTPVENKFNLKSIYAAGSETPDLLRREGLESPAISHEHGNVQLPFAMAMPAPDKKQAEKETFISNLALGIFLVGLFLGND